MIRTRPSRPPAPSLAAALTGLVLTATAAPGQESFPSGTPEVFARFGAAVVKVEVREGSAGLRRSAGSGFYVSPDGLVVTNYHVVASVVFEPDDYRVVIREVGADEREAELLTVDAVNDLAILKTDRTEAPHFTPGVAFVPRGQRLYSLGHPQDLGLSIVEGTFNGRLSGALPRIHFTGSVNPGMSGGPAITEDGRVVGINVSTAGNQMSFLVPADRLGALLHRLRRGPRGPSLVAEVRRQLYDHQDAYLRGLFLGGATPTTSMGEYAVPTRPTDAFNCWGDWNRVPDGRYEVLDHLCSTEDVLFVSDGHTAGTVRFHHQLVRSEELNRFQFHALLSSLFLARYAELPGDAEYVTRFRCRPANVAAGSDESVPVRAVFCARRYRNLDGLYDVVVKVATLGGRTQGLLSALTMSGVSFENARVMTYRYLSRIGWTR